MQKPDKFQLLNPDFLSRTSWAHQAAYHALQTEIDTIITDINSMIAVVLVNTTSETVKTYETHGNAVWGVREAVDTDIEVLRESECKDQVLDHNEVAVQGSGFRSLLCITTFNSKVKLEVDAVQAKVNEMNVHFGNIALNVYRAYIGVNPMVEGEAIERLINSTYIEVTNHWLSVKPDINALRTTLTNNINALKTTVAACFVVASGYMDSNAVLIREQIDYCNQYTGTRSNFDAYEKFKSSYAEVEKQFPEFVW